MSSNEFITEETHYKLGRYADWLQQSTIKKDFCMARSFLVGMGLKEEALVPAWKVWFRHNATFEVARLVLGLSETQAYYLFYFRYSDNEIAEFTCRSSEERAWIGEWRKTRSLIKRRDLAVKVIRHYMEKWRAPHDNSKQEAIQTVAEFEENNPRPWKKEFDCIYSSNEMQTVVVLDDLEAYIDALRTLAGVEK